MKRLEKIKFTKNGIILTFDKEIIIDESTYAENYFYVGKEFSDDEILLLEHQSELIKIKKKLILKIKKKSHSSKEIVQYLKDNKFNDEDIKHLLIFLKENYLIDDDKLAQEITELLNYKNCSYREIKDKLLSRGLPLVIEYDENLEQRKIGHVINQKQKMLIKHYGINELKQKLTLMLIKQGFNKELINNAISQINIDSHHDQNIVEKEIIKYQRYHGLSEENKQKLIAKLMRKGFSYYDIINKLGEINDGKND